MQCLDQTPTVLMSFFPLWLHGHPFHRTHFAQLWPGVPRMGPSAAECFLRRQLWGGREHSWSVFPAPPGSSSNPWNFLTGSSVFVMLIKPLQAGPLKASTWAVPGRMEPVIIGLDVEPLDQGGKEGCWLSFPVWPVISSIVPSHETPVRSLGTEAWGKICIQRSSRHPSPPPHRVHPLW